MPEPIDSGERHALIAFLRAVEVHALLYLRVGTPVIAPGDLEGDLIHACAVIAAAFVHRFKSRLEQQWCDGDEEQSRITLQDDLPPTGDGSVPAEHGSESTSESSALQSLQKTRAALQRRILRLWRRR